LARFNVFTLAQGKSKDYTGLPAPAAAVTLAGLVMLYVETGRPELLRVLVAVVPIVSLLMASTIRYDGFPKLSFREKGANRFKLLILIITLLLFAIFPQYVLFPFMILFIIHGLLRAVGTHFSRRADSTGEVTHSEHQPTA
jgi:phosphatidylserine synthase